MCMCMCTRTRVHATGLGSWVPLTPCECGTHTARRPYSGVDGQLVSRSPCVVVDGEMARWRHAPRQGDVGRGEFGHQVGDDAHACTTRRHCCVLGHAHMRYGRVCVSKRCNATPF